MKNLMLALVLALSFAPLAFAASDCAHTCCYTYNGAWDDDFDDCRSPDGGYDACTSDCEARTISESGLTHPDTTNAEHYTCCGTAFILAAFAGALFLHRE